MESHRIADSSIEMPELKDSIVVENPSNIDVKPEEVQTRVIKLSDNPGIKASWEKYIEEKWWPWAEEDRRIRKVQAIYTKLYSVYQKQQRLGEAYEVVIGLGLLSWKFAGYDIRRHIVTARTNVEFDSSSGVIEVRAAAEGAKTTLEQDMIDPKDRPEVEQQQLIETMIKDTGDEVWQPSMQDVLKSYANALSSEGQYNYSLEKPESAKAQPVITFAPALILRKRTERSLLLVYQEIIKQIAEGKAIPSGVKRIVEIIDDRIDEENGDENNDGKMPEEIYFPLPSNDEQRRIAELLKIRSGILVQGPPGTGKSHTIANIVCHLLALGKRVLVTSHTARALKVLRYKFPNEIAYLCVLLLGDDQDAMKSLEESVQQITERYNNFDREESINKIENIEHKLKITREQEANLLKELRSIREKDIYVYSNLFGSYEGTAQTIAQRVSDKEQEFGWLSETPKEDEKQPLSNQEALELLGLLREIDKEKQEELSKNFTPSRELPPPEEFEANVAEETKANAEYKKTAPYRSYPGYSDFKILPDHLRYAFMEAIRDLLNAYENINRYPYPWVKKAMQDVLTLTCASWKELCRCTTENLHIVKGLIEEIANVKIVGYESRDRRTMRRHAEALLAHIKNGRGLGFWVFRPKVVREALYLLKDMRIDRLPFATPERLETLLNWIDVQDAFAQLHKNWSSFTDPPVGIMHIKLAGYKDLHQCLVKILILEDKINPIDKLVQEIRSNASKFQLPHWDNIEELQQIVDALGAVDLEKRLHSASNKMTELAERLKKKAVSPNAHPIVKDILTSIEKRMSDDYRDAYTRLKALEVWREKLQRRNKLLEKLNTITHRLANELVKTSNNPAWDERLSKLETAWSWAQANAWLKRIADPEELERLSRKIDEVKTSIRQYLEALAAEKAWLYCFEEMTEHERQHLLAWTKAIKRIGKGTGKHTNKHRKTAREHMDQCRTAIPAWVMPIYRVAETIRPGTDSFDVIIIDEASQSGPEALFLTYLAKQIIVVGDDKQISPDSVGLDRDEVELLRKKHIEDLPHSDVLGVDNSFFDQAEVRYGGRLRLREHFRCMPEIIQFSNNLCYRGEPLVPLRQYGSARLSPVLQAINVQTGFQKGRSPRVVNEPEAEAIVEKISECCKDTAYDGKTFGVISLLGEGQAHLIEQLLLQKIGPEEMEKRALVCGDAYAFQGDERDVMFLSMVSAPTEGQRIGTLAKASDERRFNVAVSRAKDQVFLFHSATLNDLSPQCLRYRLLEYLLEPKVQPLSDLELEIDIATLRNKARFRSDIKPPTPFDSWFEVNIFLKLVERGYRVIPQYEVAGYYIE
jgi:hypothetical protein